MSGAATDISAQTRQRPQASPVTLGLSRRAWLWLALGVLAVALVVGAAFALDALVERWMDRQLRDASAAYLNPALDFDELDYEFPLTVTVTNARLSVEDGRIVEAEQLTLGLAELPSRAEPLQIESIEVDGLVVRILSTPHGAAGFSDFFTGLKDPDVHASDMFVLRQLSLAGAEVVWVPEDSESMRVDAISGDVAIARVESDGSAREYDITLRTSKGEMIQAAAEARVNFDTLHVELRSGELHVKVTEETRDALPPALRKLMKDHGVSGMFDGTIAGSFPLRDPVEGELSISAKLRDFSLSIGALSFPVELLTLELDLHDHVVSLDPAELEAFTGTLSLHGQIDLSDDASAPAELGWEMSGLSLASLAPNSDIEGRVSGSGHAQVDAHAPQSSLRGRGQLRVRNGRLITLPGLRELARDGSLRGRHEGDASFELRRDHVNITSLDIETPMLGFRGAGTLDFDGRVDLVIHVGPLQKVDVEGPMGKFVRAGGALVPYVVKGSIRNPKIRARPFGIGANLRKR